MLLYFDVNYKGACITALLEGQYQDVNYEGACITSLPKGQYATTLTCESQCCMHECKHCIIYERKILSPPSESENAMGTTTPCILQSQ